MGRRIIHFSIAIAIILLLVFMQGGCGNALLENLIVDVERATNNILIINTDGNGTTDPSGEVIVKDGEVVNISATQNTGYVFTSWTGTGITFGNRYAADTTVTLAGKTATITAHFADEGAVFNLTVQSTGNGVTDPSGTIPTLPAVPVIISATPDFSYEFVNWTGPLSAVFGDDTSANTTVTITDHSIIQAHFNLLQYDLTVTNDGNGTTNPFGTQTVTHGDATPIAATVTDPMRYVFKEWTVPIGTAQIGNSSSAATTATLTSGDATVQANFDKYGLYWTLYSSPYTVNRATFDFSDMDQIANSSTGPCAGIDLDIANEHVYFSDYSGKIWKCDLDGSSPSNIYSTGGYIYAVALDLVNNKLYFACSSIGIGRINLDGNGYQTVISGPNYRGVAVDAAGGYVYLANMGGIYRADITGGMPQTPSFLFSASAAYEIDLDIDAGQMYWVEYSGNGRCGRAFMNGTGGVTYIVPGGLSYPRGIDLDVSDVANKRMYIANQNSNMIHKYDLSGNLISSFSASGSPSGIVVDTD